MGLQEKHRCSAWGSHYAVTLEAIIQPPAATIVRLRLNSESHRLFSLASFQQLNRDRCSRCFFASPRGVFLDVDDLAFDLRRHISNLEIERERRRVRAASALVILFITGGSLVWPGCGGDEVETPRAPLVQALEADGTHSPSH